MFEKIANYISDGYRVLIEVYGKDDPENELDHLLSNNLAECLDFANYYDGDYIYIHKQ
jgi:hypothetical protein